MSHHKVPCPACGADLKIDGGAPAGKVIRCPECGVGLILSGEKNHALKVTESPRPSPSDKKAKPRLAWGMGGVLLLAPARG